MCAYSSLLQPAGLHCTICLSLLSRCVGPSAFADGDSERCVVRQSGCAGRAERGRRDLLEQRLMQLRATDGLGVDGVGAGGEEGREVFGEGVARH